MASSNALVLSLLLAALAAILHACAAAATSAAGADYSILDLGYDPQDLSSEERLQALFDSWMLQHGKSYADNALSGDSQAGEKATRYGIFKDNLRFIHGENEKNQGYFLGLNAFADLTNEEFRAQRHGGRFDRSRERTSHEEFRYGSVQLKDLPDSIDWREKGAVVGVKDQGSCGSCWAFSAVAAIEGVNKLATGELVSLSEQELVDCDKGEDEGCNGGLMDYAFGFVIKNGGLDTEADYPYKGYGTRCDRSKMNAKVVTIDGYEDVPVNDETALLKAVAHQPVSVAIDAGGSSMQFYRSGIFTGRCGTDLDHGVTNVGYGKEDGKAYWIIKNSWGSNWGEKGYVKMARNTGLAAGLCGINMEASYPTKTGANPPNPGPTPPSPAPPPNECDDYYTCPESSTCCCLFNYGKYCFAWGCCPLQSATCCEDHYHCCPSDFPICNLQANTCLRSSKDLLGTKMLERTPARYTGGVDRKSMASA
ncbi:hypothetical protein SELMODRAFT_153766 [Selaginella moellendorffii]|uniref:Granulins domain-containing protein n=1 Tax=Selaginella moellendorffii TaxID=88036 RepID=D8SAR3_SELML|nr:low-temperature-induced cysteine proteinase [Selaginella moellendorffii]EFJ18470.1 hypothetical protein SELMODRAFT_153766 [Selaginella moellendorffii]|eukprot:XP_002980210.1 low-temperature-induced cysteine proteinase [Selaginella moellendorffii]